jgi:hypothetical protein
MFGDVEMEKHNEKTSLTLRKMDPVIGHTLYVLKWITGRPVWKLAEELIEYGLRNGLPPDLRAALRDHVEYFGNEVLGAAEVVDSCEDASAD